MGKKKGKTPSPPPSPKPDPASESSVLPKKFDAKTLEKSVIALPLLLKLEAEEKEKKKDAEEGKAPKDPIKYRLIIDLNLQYEGGREGARKQVNALIEKVRTALTLPPVKEGPKSQQFLFTTLTAAGIRLLVEKDVGKTNADGTPGKDSHERAIYRIWEDFPVKPLTVKSISTVKANAAHNAFAALGEDIVWAIMDSGIDETHPHFALYENLTLPAPLKHQDFSASTGNDADKPLVDRLGHGTHVAGILAGALIATKEEPAGEPKSGEDDKPARKGKDKTRIAITASYKEHISETEVKNLTIPLAAISGMAPKCKLVSLKVLDGEGNGLASGLIAALEYIQEVNGHGRRILIHGVNMSVGYSFEPEWFACGQSPLCVEVDRLVRSGVVVVVAAGNTGYGYNRTLARGDVASGLPLSINDPGNAELAITVGSTHRDMPHVYGVSYFSSKGPTGDGRRKPDLVAPGEKIISCDAKPTEEKPDGNVIVGKYKEDSGTSMAAPHVSGVIAAFLSVRREFIGRPEEVKEIFLSTATDLRREPSFQGRGLVDLMRAIQSV